VNKAIIYILSMMLVGLAFLTVYTLLPGYFENQRTQSSLAQMEKALQQQQQEMRDLRRDLAALRDSHSAIERVAREKLGLCREGEKIYHFDSPSGMAPAPEKR